jgi:hypothetical protein
MNNIIMKQRGGVRQEAIDGLLHGYLPELSHLVAKHNDKHLVALQRFCTLMSHLHGKPKVHIGYEREAYVKEDDTVRVTFDRHVMAEENLDATLTTEFSNRAVKRFVGQVILELKFTNRFPNWFRGLVERFNVMQCGAAKYVSAVEGLGHMRLDATTPVVEEAHDLCDYS